MRIAERTLLALPALALLSYVVMGVSSLVFSGSFRFSLMMEHLLSSELRYTVLLTLKYAFLGLAFSWVLAWSLLLILRGGGTSVFRFFSVLPGMAYALLVLLVLRLLKTESPYSMRSVLMAWTMAGVPFLCGGISEGIRDLGPKSKEALRALGAGPVRAFFHHEFRGTLPLQGALLLQQFWFFLTSFSLVMILSGGPPWETLEVAIYSAMRLGQTDVSKAVAIGLVQASILALVRMGLIWVRSAAGSRGISEGYRESNDSGGWFGILAVLVLCLMGAIWLAFRIENAGDFIAPLLLTIILGGCVAGFTLIFSVSSYFSGFRSISILGAWFSPLLLSLSVWSLTGLVVSPFLNVALIQTLFFAPWFSQILFPLLDRAQRAEMEAARVFGAGKVRAFFEVEWPRLQGGVRRVLGLVFALSATEVSSVMLFSRGDFDTLASYSQNLFARFRIEEASFGVLAMLLVSAIALTIGERRA
ncbi:MAG: hypothetical protein KGP28_02430 [Bdellovibrionales bacterium]|nr:hypothetical protein [Bdellovibrionales bacterium]